MATDPHTRKEAEVWEACDALFQSGEKLTGRAIHEQLGKLGYNKGSFNEVYKYLKTWMKNRGINNLKDISPSERVALPDPLLRAVTTVREELQNEAEQQVLAMQAEMETVITETNTRYEESQRALNELQNTYHNLLNENKALASQLQQIREDYQVEQKAHAATLARANQLEAQYQTAREDLNKTIAQAKQDLQQQAQQHQQEIDELRDTQENQRHKFLADLDALKTEKFKLEHQIHLQQQDYKTLQKKWAELEQSWIQLDLNLEAAINREKQFNQQLQEHNHTIILLKKDLSHAQRQGEEWKNLYQKLQTTLLEKQEQLGQLEQRLLQSQSEKKKRDTKQ